VTYGEPAGTGDFETGSPAARPSLAAPQSKRVSGEAHHVVPTTGLTIYGCGQDEAAVFREMAPGCGVVPTITDAALSHATVDLACGNRCISVGHKTRVSASVLRALRQVGVRYLSTRSIGYNHIDVQCAESLGMSVQGVVYSPDGVADYTLMLILMAVRNAKSTISRAQVHDYRLNEVRGRDLRDMTVGVVGTGNIGTAVLDRLQGFGCDVVAYDRCPKTSARYVTLDEILERSDVVTLHITLNAETHHFLNARRIEQMRHGAVVVNTGRGALLDTEALVGALESGRLGGAALDVVEGEEGVFYTDHSGWSTQNWLLSRLEQLPNVLITPHTAYYTERALRDAVENTLINCRWFERRAAWLG
jgi:D-specific alpha-keto acid dehydrogenase